MKIAIYHGFYNLHFEMLGYVFEYFKTNNMLLEIDIYCYINIFSYEWWSFYNKIFNVKLKWYNPALYYSQSIVELYNYVFLMTDDDYSLQINEKIDTKIISIEHIDYTRNNNAFIRIGTRFFVNRPNLNWAIPCFKAINQNDKLLLLQNQNKINVLIVGKNQPKSIKDLIDLFKNYNDINFHLVNRELLSDFDNNDNIFLYNDCLTSIMLDLFSKSHYVLCFDKENINHYIKQAISGAIHLGFTFGCKLILPESWNFFYNFKSSLSYSFNKDPLTLTQDTNLDLIFNEQLELINHRNLVFDKALNI